MILHLRCSWRFVRWCAQAIYFRPFDEHLPSSAVVNWRFAMTKLIEIWVHGVPLWQPSAFIHISDTNCSICLHPRFPFHLRRSDSVAIQGNKHWSMTPQSLHATTFRSLRKNVWVLANIKTFCKTMDKFHRDCRANFDPQIFVHWFGNKPHHVFC